jgi:hypothetical protein
VLGPILVQQRHLLPEHVADYVQGLLLQVMQVELEPDCGQRPPDIDGTDAQIKAAELISNADAVAGSVRLDKPATSRMRRKSLFVNPTPNCGL